MINERNRTKLLLSLGILVAIIIGFLVYRQFTLARLEVNAPEGSALSIATGRGGEFKSIGTTKASYSQGAAGVVHVRAQAGESITIESVELKRGETARVDIGLEQSRPAERYARGTLSSLHEENGFIYGIDDQTKSLDYTHPREEQTFFSYFSVPTVRSVIWNDTKNFAFNSFGLGVGFVTGGKLSSVPDSNTGEYSQFYDMYRADDRPLVLLGSGGIFIQDGLTDSPRRIVEVNIQGAPSIFSDHNHIYLYNLKFNTVEDELDLPEPTGADLSVYDYTGDLIFTKELPLARAAHKIVATGQGEIIILTEDGVVSIGTNGELNSAPFYFVSAQDLVVLQDELMILSTDGLWRYDVSSLEYRLVSPFENNEVYVPNSLTILGDGYLYFSAGISRDTVNSNSGLNTSIFRTRL